MSQIAGFRGVLAQDAAKPAGADLAKRLAAGSLVRDPGRAVYRYHQVFAGHGGRPMVRKSVICAVQLAPWSDGAVRPHEAVVPAARDAALAKIRTNRGHTEPFVAGYRDPASEVDRLMRRVEATQPTLSYTSKDGVVHQVWRMSDAETLGKLRHYLAPKPLHVLEGHDRYEAMLAYQEELAAKQSILTYSSANYGLAYLVNFDDPTLAAAPRHRIVRGSGAKREAVLAAASTHFIVEKLPGAAKDLAAIHGGLASAVAHQPVFVAVFAGDADAWKLTLSPDVSPVAEGVAVHRALQKLDPIVLQHLFVERHLPNAQLTTELDPTRALAELGQGAEVVLLVRPVSVSQIAQVDELGALLPAGSTAFFPPVASGLVSLVVDPDEDLV
ncbi:MAG: DUF1015 family protein [Kofleriaceae bacterium]